MPRLHDDGYAMVGPQDSTVMLGMQEGLGAAINCGIGGLLTALFGPAVAGHVVDLGHVHFHGGVRIRRPNGSDTVVRAHPSFYRHVRLDAVQLNGAGADEDVPTVVGLGLVRALSRASTLISLIWPLSAMWRRQMLALAMTRATAAWMHR
jgi:hypothetical protein